MEEFRNIKPKDDALVVRHNKLIEARYETTLHQQRIMLWLISEIRPEDRDFQKYRVTIKELAKFVGLEKNKNVYRQIAEATGGMVGRLVEIGSLEDDEYLQVSLVSSAKYKIGQGFVDLSIDPELMPYLLDLKANFTKAYLRDLMSMKSAYSIRLYDLLNQYRKVGKRSLEVDELKRMLGIENKYKLYGDFHRRVITPSVKEINERTDLFVAYTERKEGRSVKWLDFTIAVKEVFREARSEEGQGATGSPEMLARLMSHGVKETEALKLINLYGETDPDRITGNLDKLEEGIRAGKIKKPVPWLRKAINEDYRDQKSLFQKNIKDAEREAKERAAERDRKAREVVSIERQMEEQEQAYVSYRREFVASAVAEIDVDSLEEWEEEFRTNLPAPLRKTWGDKPQWDSRLTLSQAEKFIADKVGRRCLDQDVWFSENGYPELEGLQMKREALL